MRQLNESTTQFSFIFTGFLFPRETGNCGVRGTRGAGEEASDKNAKFFLDTDTTVGQAGS